MQTSRRNIFRGALAAGLTAGLPSMGAASSTADAGLKARYAKLFRV